MKQDFKGFTDALLVVAWEGGSYDGADLLDVALKYGIVKKVEVTESCGDNCQCAEYEFPSTCYQKTYDEFNPDWDMLEATQDSLREHMAVIKKITEDLNRHKDAVKILENIIALENSGLMDPERLRHQTNKARDILELW